MSAPTRSTGRDFFTSPAGWVFCVFAVIALFFLVAEHRAHLGFVLPYLPLALVGLCVALHSYMHRVKHNHDRGGLGERDGQRGKHGRHHVS